MNTSVSRGEHEAQMLLRIFKAQESAKDLGKPFTWDELRARLLKSKPACAACMPGMFKFLKKFGGGMLARTEAFIKSSAGSSRQLGPDFFEHLSLDPKPQTQNPCVMFRHALLVAGYTCPIDKFLNASDVKKLFAKDFMPDNIAANAMMGEIDSLIKATFPTEHPHKSEIDQLQVAFERNLVMVALQKKHKDLPDLADLNECAIALCSGIEKATGGTVALHHMEGQRSIICFVYHCKGRPGTSVPLLSSLKFARFAFGFGSRTFSFSITIPPSFERKKIAQRQMREYDESGNLKNPAVLLEEKGFSVGKYVVRKKDKVLGQISAISADKVTLEVDGDFYRVSWEGFVSGQWKVTDAPAEKEPIDLKACSPSDSLEVETQICKGRILQKLCELERKHADCLEKIRVYSKPRSVEASQPVNVGKMVLVPSTLRIECVRDYDPFEGHGGICLGLCGAENATFFLQPTCIPPAEDRPGFIAPFWMVKGTPDPEMANCKVAPLVAGTDRNDSLSKIPVLKNFKALKEGDVLLQHVAPKVVELEALESLPKRRRAKGA